MKPSSLPRNKTDDIQRIAKRIVDYLYADEKKWLEQN